MINSYSKKTTQEKIDLLPNISAEDKEKLKNQQQDVLKKLTENVISAYSLPLSISPNCLINNKYYQVPMVTEESSIVAACSNAFKFIASNGGFECKVLSDLKMGTIYFEDQPGLVEFINSIDPKDQAEIKELNKNMSERNAGVLDHLASHVGEFIKVTLFFSTAQSMGANFINTILEKYTEIIVRERPQAKPIMSILSNNYENSLVEASFKIKKDALTHTNLSAQDFMKKFKQAITIATIDPDRAMTHNKGLMNGVDAVLLATGQDYRAMNAALHAYASKSGSYSSLSYIKEDPDHLIFCTTLPYSLGVVGGITGVHPTVKTNLSILEKNCSVETLAMVMAATGLAQNFAAVSALISLGIQKGHMKMHLSNILVQIGATPKESLIIQEFFKSKDISFKKVNELLNKIRAKTNQNNV